MWRKLQRYGALALPSAGHVLPNSAANEERLEWLAETVRSYGGQASLVQVQSFDDLSDSRLRQLFLEASSGQYERLLRDSAKPGFRPTRITRVE